MADPKYYDLDGALLREASEGLVRKFEIFRTGGKWEPYPDTWRALTVAHEIDAAHAEELAKLVDSGAVA